MLNEDIQQARMYGVNAVPTIVTNGKYKLSGAQPIPFYTNGLEN